MRICTRKIAGNLVLAAGLSWGVSGANAYEVAIDLASKADLEITAAMQDRSKWPYVADNSWGLVANYVPIVRLPRDQQAVIFGNHASPVDRTNYYILCLASQ